MRESSVLGTSAGDADAEPKTTEAKKCPPLKLLHFYNNMSGDGGAKAVADIVLACPDLEDFRFSATRSTPVGCEATATVRSFSLSILVFLNLFLYLSFLVCVFHFV
jgi:hypothetical protein